MEWPAWRLVFSEPQIATLELLQTTWTIEDVAKANALLDRQDAIRWAAAPKGD